MEIDDRLDLTMLDAVVGAIAAYENAEDPDELHEAHEILYEAVCALLRQPVGNDRGD